MDNFYNGDKTVGDLSREDRKICTLEGVREHAEGDPVELWWYGAAQRFVIRCRNECGNNYTLLDLHDLIIFSRGNPALEGEEEARPFLSGYGHIR